MCDRPILVTADQDTFTAKVKNGIHDIVTSSAKYFRTDLIDRHLVRVEEVGKKDIIVRSESGQRESLPRKDLHHCDYGYVHTTYASQGKTAERVLAILGENCSKNAWYVALSRAKNEVAVVTSDKEVLRKKSEVINEKENALAFTTEQTGWARAVAEPVCEKELILPQVKSLGRRLIDAQSVEERQQILTAIATSENAVEEPTQLASKRKFGYQKKAQDLIELGDFRPESLQSLAEEIKQVPLGVGGREAGIVEERAGKSRELAKDLELGLDNGM